MSEAWKAWERAIAAEAKLRGLPWERRLRLGDDHDMLDIDGSSYDGWLVGGKAISRKGNLADRLSEAMNQCQRAVANFQEKYPGQADDIIPVQIVQRQGHGIAGAYAVMEYRYLLDLVVERRKWRANQ